MIEFDKGLDREKVIKISKIKKEPKWMLEYRLDSFDKFINSKEPKFGPKINLDINNITFYKALDNEVVNKWSEVDKDINNTFEEIGIQKAEKEYLGGVHVQFESKALYQNMIDELKEKNVIFTDTDTALQNYPEIFKKYFGTLVKNDDNKYASLNGSVWSGGTFIYVPPHTKLERPLQSYFRINTKEIGQFERTLIIVDEGSELHYIEGCTAPKYSSDSLHAAVVEIFVEKNAKCR